MGQAVAGSVVGALPPDCRGLVLADALRLDAPVLHHGEDAAGAGQVVMGLMRVYLRRSVRRARPRTSDRVLCGSREPRPRVRLGADMRPFVPDSFVPPLGLEHPAFRLRPLGPEHNASDFAAWTSSIDHIRATPGFDGLSWPHAMTLEENLAGLVRHADDFAARTGFTYTVLAPTDDASLVIGCVYIYPGESPGFDARVRSWVRAADADLDPALYRAVTEWLRDDWPFLRVGYAPRHGGEVIA